MAVIQAYNETDLLDERRGCGEQELVGEDEAVAAKDREIEKRPGHVAHAFQESEPKILGHLEK